MKMLIEDIKNKQFKNIYLLTGEELYLRNQYRKRLREALLDPEDTMNYASFEGKNINPKEVIDLAETMPFFADRRVIEISDSGFAKNACPELAEYIPEIPDSTCIILTESEVDKRGKFYKAEIKNSSVKITELLKNLFIYFNKHQVFLHRSLHEVRPVREQEVHPRPGIW